MTKAQKIQILIDDHDFTEDDLKGLTVAELDELLPDVPESDKEESGKLPADFLFGQILSSVDKKSKTPKLIETKVDFRIIKFKSGSIKFVKDQEVSKSDLELMSDYQKEYYLK